MLRHPATQDPVLAIGSDSRGQIFFLTRQGLLRFQNDQIVQEQVIEGLSDVIGKKPALHSFLMDRENNIWIGTDGDGLHRFKPTPITAYGKDKSLADVGFMAITEDLDGRLWFAGDRVFRYDPRNRGVSPFPSLRAVAAVFNDLNGDVWFGGYKGLQRLRDGQITAYRPKAFEGGDLVASIYRDRRHDLWIGVGSPDGRGGLYRFLDGQWKRQEGLLFHDVRFITEDRLGALWVGGMEGLARCQNGACSHYTTKQGLSFNYVRAIHEDKDGALWIGTYGGGLNRLKDGHFVVITKADGLFDDVISRLLEDDRGNFWMSSNRGIFRASHQELSDFADGKTRSVASISYGTGDGMKTDECNGGGQPAGWKARDGTLWFPTIKGVVAVNPRQMNTLLPPVALEEFMRSGKLVSTLAGIDLPPGSGDLEFHYSGLSLVAAEKIRFQYKLEGFDGKWIDAGARRIAYYTNIPPGKYSFRVKASNNDGFWNESGATLQFYLRPHFYQTGWFQLLCGLVVLVVGAGLYRFRVTTLRARQAELESKVRERTGELQQQVAYGNRIAGDLKRTAAIVEFSYDAIWSTDMAGNLLTWNQGAEAIFGYSEEEALGKSVSMLLPEERAEELSRHLNEMKAGKCVQHFETVRLAKDGVGRDISLSLSPIYRDEAIIGVSAIARDIAERKKMDRLLQQAKEAAETATRSKSEFLANMSHEIRTPMNGILGMTELALTTELTSEQQEFLGLVKSSADSLLVIIDDILDYSKIEAGKLMLNPEPFSLQDLVSDVMKGLAPVAHKKGLEFAFQVAGNVPPFLAGDPVRLRQVIVNLLGNAIKFTKTGEVALSVNLERENQHGPLIHFSVTDTGIGVPLEKQQTIFQSFEQADSSTTRQYGGTGLGLAISSRIVQMMGGAIQVQSTPGEGSRFYFTVQFGIAEAGECSPAPFEETGLRGIRALVVDDNATNRRILLEMLTRMGIDVVAADCGVAALRALQQVTDDKTFHLMVIDEQMPGMDGFELLQRVRACDSWSSLAIMMLTSVGQTANSSRCRALDVETCLIKPVNQTELQLAIQRALDVQRISVSPYKDTIAHIPRQRLRILVAEDNAVNQKLALYMLQRMGHEVVISSNGSDALNKWAEEHFDIIFMDIQMPEMDGFETTREIRSREKLSGNHIPIIAMTAHAMSGDRECCLTAGMDDYVSKPVSSSALLTAIAAFFPALPDPVVQETWVSNV